jgi:hypothetical protein
VGSLIRCLVSEDLKSDKLSSTLFLFIKKIDFLNLVKDSPAISNESIKAGEKHQLQHSINTTAITSRVIDYFIIWFTASFNQKKTVFNDFFFSQCSQAPLSFG